MAKENENEKTVKMLIEDNTALMLELGSLKRQLGGLKTSNANYRKQVENLQEQLDMANLTNGELRGQIASYNNQILDYKDRIEELKRENQNLRIAMEYKKEPWWKRIF